MKTDDNVSYQLQLGDKLQLTPSAVTDNCNYADPQRLTVVTLTGLSHRTAFGSRLVPTGGHVSHKSLAFCPM